MSSAQIYPSEKLDLLFKHLQWWYIQKGLEKNIVPKKKTTFKRGVFSFLNDILWQEKSLVNVVGNLFTPPLPASLIMRKTRESGSVLIGCIFLITYTIVSVNFLRITIFV